MLQSFKDRLRTSRWLGYVIVGAISIPFALWGIQAYMGGGGQTTVAEVNGQPIPAAEVERQVSQRRQMLRQRFGGELPAMFTDQLIRRQVVEQLVARELLRQTAAEANLQVDAETLSREIRGQSWFQRDGSFDRELYRQTLAQSGLSPAQYESGMRESQRLRQLRQGVVDSAFVLPGEAERLARLQRQERLVTSLRYPRSAAREAVEVDDAAIEQFYEQHKDRYRTPEQVRLAYLELDLEALASQVEVTEDELRQAYEERRDRARQQTAREAAHILIEPADDGGAAAREQALAEARKLRQRIVEEGADFAEVARKHSDDPGSSDQGGNLGYITRGTMVEPFEKALFSLPEPGAVSEPVATTYGYHLIKLLDERKQEAASFAEARDELEQDLRRRRAEERFYERLILAAGGRRGTFPRVIAPE